MQVKDDDILYKGQHRSYVENKVLLLPTLARRIIQQVKDYDDLYKGQRKQIDSF